MTGDELERAIEFLLESRARHDARTAEINEHLARTDEQLAQTSMLVREYTAMRSEFVQVVTRTFDAQARIDDSFRASLGEVNALFRTSLSEVSESFRRPLEESAAITRRTDERLDRLAAIVERHVGGA